ncbi:iron-sulfur cluster assembly protein [Myxococcaceae bacterium GXIMD 01537]
MRTEAELLAQIQTVPDPCSYSAGVPLSIGEMGLLLGLTNDAGRVTVRMRITSPMCMMVAYFMREIEERLLAQEGVESVHVEFDRAFDWQPGDIQDDARQRLLDRRIRMIGGRMLQREGAAAGGCGHAAAK